MYFKWPASSNQLLIVRVALCIFVSFLHNYNFKLNLFVFFLANSNLKLLWALNKIENIIQLCGC